VERIEVNPRATIYLGDPAELKGIEADALVADPPYGCANDCDYTRFSGGRSPSLNYHAGIHCDNAPFDPRPWLTFPKVVLFRHQCFSDRLPVGTVLVWLRASKRRAIERARSTGLIIDDNRSVG